MRLSVLVALALACACTPAPQNSAGPPRSETVYARYAAREHEPAFQAALAAPARKVQELAWLVGDWNNSVTVFATPGVAESHTNGETATFHVQGDSVIASRSLDTLLTYDGFAQRWITIGVEPPAAAFTRSVATGEWDGHSLAFEGDVVLFGETFALRQTLTKISNDEFEILNEQRVAPGRYVRVDMYHYTRMTTPRDPEDSRPG